MAKYCAKCGKPLPNGVEICPDCVSAPQGTEAALFTRITAETEVWKESEEKVKRARPKLLEEKSGRQKLLFGAAGVLVAAFVVFAILFTRPAPRVVRAINGGEYDRAAEIYWSTTSLPGGERVASIDKAILKAADGLCTRYANHEIDADSASTALSKLGTFGDGAEELLADSYAKFRTLSSSQEHMTQAEKLFRNGDYLAARAEYLQVIEWDIDFSDARAKAEDCITQYTGSVLSAADIFIQTKDFASAILTLEEGKDTLFSYDTFSEKLDAKLEAAYGLFENYVLDEAKNLAELGDFEAAAALIAQNMESFALEEETLSAAIDDYLRLARSKMVSDAAQRAIKLYNVSSYAEAFAALDGLRGDLEGPTDELDAETVKLEERFITDMKSNAKEIFAGERGNLEKAVAALEDALKIRPLEQIREYKEHLEKYLPVSLVEMEYTDKSGTVFRSGSDFESVDGTKFTDGWIWGENGAEMTFRLDCAFDELNCTFAVRRDDDANANGRYTVWCDGEKVYESDYLYHWDKNPIPASIDVSGRNELKIVFTSDYEVSTTESGYCYHGLCSPILTKDMEGA